MFKDTKAHAFLKEKLSANDLAEFMELFGVVGSEKLRIRPFNVQIRIGEGRYPKGLRTDRTFSIEDDSDTHRLPVFPSDEKVLELAQKYLKVKLEILERDMSHYPKILVRIAGGTASIERQVFVRALEKETEFLK